MLHTWLCYEDPAATELLFLFIRYINFIPQTFYVQHRLASSGRCVETANIFFINYLCNIEYSQMTETHKKLNELFKRIPRRHTTDNVKEMYIILKEYEELLQMMEVDARYEQQVAPFFDALDPIRTTVKKSNDNKASKKVKDELFDEASGVLKDTIQELMQLSE